MMLDEKRTWRRCRTCVRHAIDHCHNELHDRYDDWGGRGIKVYAPWLKNKELFIRYLVQLPDSNNYGLVLDRIDNNKGYEPGNLRFVTCLESNLNKRQRYSKTRALKPGTMFGNKTAINVKGKYVTYVCVCGGQNTIRLSSFFASERCPHCAND